MTEQKRGRGRPKMAPGEAKTFIFSIRVSLDERALIEKKAEADGMSSSDWAREVILAAATNEET